VQQNLRRLHDHRPTFAEREQVRAERIATVQALLAQGMSYREIARTMNTSYNTVRRLVGSVERQGAKGPFSADTAQVCPLLSFNEISSTTTAPAPP
jgi:Trp operon repressor